MNQCEDADEGKGTNASIDASEVLPLVDLDGQIIRIAKKGEGLGGKLVDANGLHFNATLSQSAGSVLYISDFERDMAQPTSLWRRWPRWGIRERKQFELILLTNLQIQLERPPFLAIDLPNNLETENFDIEVLRLGIVRANDGDVMDTIKHLVLREDVSIL
jgi:hypothetical protein